MAVMLLCQLNDDDDVIDDVSVVTSRCEWPRNLVGPVIDLQQRRRQRQLLSNKQQTSSSSSSVSMRRQYLVDFAVCVPPLYGNIRVTDLVEFIEVQYTAISRFTKHIILLRVIRLSER